MAFTDTAGAQQDLQDSVKPRPVINDRDIVFLCPACAGELVIDREGAGMVVPCPHCEEPLTVPAYAAPPPPPSALEPTAAPVAERRFDFSGMTPEQIDRRVNEIRHQLKENRSQDTEMRGHVNRATMELHRFQLKLKKLQERQADIEAELTALNALSPDSQN